MLQTYLLISYNYLYNCTQQWRELIRVNVTSVDIEM